MFESVQNMSDILSDHEVQKNLYIVKGEAIEKFHHIIRFAKNMKQYINIIIFSWK